MKMRTASLMILYLALLAITASAQNWAYENGPIDGNKSAWQINYGFVASDSFQTNAGPNSFVTGGSIGVWLFPGDQVVTTDWSITSQENGGTVFGSGTANVTQTFISTNSFGFDIDLLNFNISNVGPLNGSTQYWLNLSNAVEGVNGDPVYWDENSGVGCMSNGCPSLAYENMGVGTIPSEAFTLTGSGAVPEPSNIMLFCSGILGLAGLLRRKLF